MANTFAPFGFQHIGYLEGSAPTAGVSVRKIASGNATPIYYGDPVTSLSTGYITQSTAGTTQIAGIFIGCKYLSTSQKRPIWLNYWPGSDANGDVEAYVIDSPNALFKVQAGGAATGILFANIQENVNFAIGTGSSSTGLSGAYADQTTLSPSTATRPFRVVSLITDPPGANGSDSVSAYNYIVVAFNAQDYRLTTGQ